MRWTPAHEAHAIERVNLTFQFAEPLPAKPFQTLLNSASLDLPKLGFNTTIDAHEVAGGPQLIPMGGPGMGLQIKFGGLGALGAGQIGQSPQFSVAGRNFQNQADGQVREEVQIHRTHFVHSSQIYGGWAAHRARVMTLLGSYLDRALPLANLQVVKMEYWDRFVFNGRSAEFAYGELLRVGSPYLPSFPSATQQLWHSHVGFFMPGPVRRLVNINVDVIDLVDAQAPESLLGPPELKRSVGLYTMAQDTLPPDMSPGLAEGTHSTLEALHTILKEQFATVITPEAADRISLNARAPS